jgi:diguanylate cyclase (GGDEF)-like protein
MTDRKQHEDELREMASTDSLTSLPNRRSFEDAARQWFGSPRGRSLSSSALMIDVDWFKQVNDTYGHEIGDLVLESLADVLRTSCRGSDIPARVGGEEFAILLPGTREDGASVVAERIRRGVEDLAIDTGQGTLRISVSVGVAEEATRDLDRLLRRADAALYRAKEQGRDRVVRASDSKRAPPRAIDAKGEPRARGVASTGLEKCQ